MGAPILEDVPNAAPGQGTVVPPVAAPAQLTPEDASALAGVPGVDPEALKRMQAGVAARQPEPVQAPQGAPAAPQAAPLNPLAVAGYVPGTSSSSTTQTILSPEAKAAQKKADEAAQAEIEATRRQSEVTQQKTAIQAQEARTVAGQAQDAHTQAIADQNAKAQAGKEHLGRISQAVTDAKAAKVDPDRWWNSRSTGQKIATTLATAFDAMGAAWSKSGSTPTIDKIHAAINNDIEAQKLAFDAKQRGVQIEETLYGAARQAGADDALAKATVRQTALDATQKKFQADLTEKTLGPEQKAAADATIARMEQARQQNALHVAELTAKHVSSTSSRTPVTNAQMAAMGQANQPANIPGAHVANPQAAQQATAHPESQQKVRDTVANWNSAIGAVRKMADIRKRVGTEVWDSDAIEQYDALANSGIGALTQMAHSGTLNEGEFERYKPFFQSLGPHLSDARRLIGGGDATLARLRGFEKAARASAENALKPYGYSFGDTSNTPTVVSRRGGYALMSDGSIRSEK